MKRFKPTNSSIIKEARLNTVTKRMYVEFKDGDVYRYDDVSTSRFVFFRDSDSKGEYFAKKVKPNHVAARLPHGFPKSVAVKA